MPGLKARLCRRCRNGFLQSRENDRWLCTTARTLLGDPSGQRTRNGVETLIWSNTEFKGWARGGNMERKIEVDFEDGKVTGWDGQNMSASRW